MTTSLFLILYEDWQLEQDQQISVREMLLFLALTLLHIIIKVISGDDEYDEHEYWEYMKCWLLTS